MYPEVRAGSGRGCERQRNSRRKTASRQRIRRRVRRQKGRSARSVLGWSMARRAVIALRNGRCAHCGQACDPQRDDGWCV